jgi:hypothetical protein
MDNDVTFEDLFAESEVLFEALMAACLVGGGLD